MVEALRRVEVLAGVLRDDRGRVLLAQRPADVHQGGLWEFPGGKREPDESRSAALQRELSEELGIAVTAHRPLIQVAHDYGDRHIVLDVHLVTAWRGEPRGLEGQPLAWIEPGRLADQPMPAADGPVLTALSLPDSYWITPTDGSRPKRFLDELAGALARGARLIQLRVFGLDEIALLALGHEVRRLCGEAGARLLVNADPALAGRLQADGVHLNARQLRELERSRTELAALTECPLVAASCHSPDELQRAERLGLDFAVLSPVLPTPSHPDAEPLGWGRFRDWVQPVKLPVYALGGMRPELLEQAWAHGGQGIAGIRGLWR